MRRGVLAVYKLSSSLTAALMNPKRASYHLNSAAIILPCVVFSIVSHPLRFYIFFRSEGGTSPSPEDRICMAAGMPMVATGRGHTNAVTSSVARHLIRRITTFFFRVVGISVN
jgi:hypothetical protein